MTDFATKIATISANSIGNMFSMESEDLANIISDLTPEIQKVLSKDNPVKVVRSVTSGEKTKRELNSYQRYTSDLTGSKDSPNQVRQLIIDAKQGNRLLHISAVMWASVPQAEKDARKASKDWTDYEHNIDFLSWYLENTATIDDQAKEKYPDDSADKEVSKKRNAYIFQLFQQG